jgi:3-oxoacyl-[acyl-carrier-protein] synthase-3
MYSKDFGIEAIEYYLPKKVISSTELSNKYKFDKNFIEKKIGVSNLYMLDDETVVDMAVNSLENLLVTRQDLRQRIDLLVVCTQTPDYQLPQTSSQIQNRCNLPKNTASFDISLGCSGFVYGLSVIESMMKFHNYSNAVLITVDAYSKIIDVNDRVTKCLFSDAAAATLVTDSGKLVSGNYSFGTDGSFFDSLIVDGSNSCGKIAYPHLYMNGRAIFNFCVSKIPDEIDKVCKINNIEKKHIDFFVLHQASKFIIETLEKKIDTNHGQFVNYLDLFGNTVSSSIPIALKQLSKSELNDKINILISGFGVGLSWASTVLTTKGDNNVL